MTISPVPPPFTVPPQDTVAASPQTTKTEEENKPPKTIPVDVQATIIVLHINGIKPVKVEAGEGRMTYQYLDPPELRAITSRLGLEGPEAFHTTMDKVFGAYEAWKSNLARFNPRPLRGS